MIKMIFITGCAVAHRGQSLLSTTAKIASYIPIESVHLRLHWPHHGCHFLCARNANVLNPHLISSYIISQLLLLLLLINTRYLSLNS